MHSAHGSACSYWHVETGMLANRRAVYDLGLVYGCWILILEMVLSVMLSVVSVWHLCSLAVIKVCGMNKKQLRFNLYIGTSEHFSLAHFDTLSSQLNRMTE